MRALPLLLLCFATSTAAADGFYYSEADGGTRVHGELAETMQSALDLRVALGMRRGHWAVEGFFRGDFATSRGAFGQGVAYDRSSADLNTVGLDVKYIQPISAHVELYLRGGVSHAYGGGALEGLGGRGLGAGAGVQVKGKVPLVGFLFWPLFFTDWGPKATCALFLDDGYDMYRLHPNDDRSATPATDAQLSHLTLGFSVGSDF